MQDIWSTIDPTTTTGTMLAGLLTDFKDALMSGCAGTARPTNLRAGGMWIDTTNQGTPNYYWSFKLYTGSGDQEVFRLSVLNGFGGTLFGDSEFDVKEVAADTAGPVLQLIKNRIANNGQVLDGDVVAEMRFIGATNTSTSPTVAYLRFTASDDETTAVYGGTLSIASTADATNTITEHLRFISAVVETVKPLKINSRRSVSQNIATTATIAALDASKIVAEMTGSTITAIQGINATQDSKFIQIHNRSSATVTLKHENASATSTNRLKLPNSADLAIIADSTAVVYYCTTDARWKIISISEPKPTRTIAGPYINLINTWTAPTGKTRIHVSGKYRSRPVCPNLTAGTGGTFVDPFGNMYAWGASTVLQPLPLADLLPRSSPVAVVGGLTFKPQSTLSRSSSSCVLTTQGSGFSWGTNASGELGDGTVIPKSSPVAVLGGLRFASIYPSYTGARTGGLTVNNKLYCWGSGFGGALGDGTIVSKSSPVAVLGGLKVAAYVPQANVLLTTAGAAYAWGDNTTGNLGVGDVATRSSPVAVLGSHVFTKLVDQPTNQAVMGLDTAGAAWAWGYNFSGDLGVGNTTSRSSPVAVLGGLVFTDIFTSYSNFFGITSDGTLYGWGDNGQGVLGLGTTNSKSSPVAVIGGLKFVQVCPGIGNMFAKTAAGVWYAWGSNGGAGQVSGSLGIGDNDAGQSLSPSVVLGGLNFEYITSTGQQTFGVMADGTLYAWGTNDTSFSSSFKGGLGVGDIVSRSSPVAVIGPAMPAQLSSFGPIPIDVVPGNTYNILLTHGACYFGDTELDLDLESITIEYN